MNARIVRIAWAPRVALSAALLVGATASLGAQAKTAAGGPDARWQAWYGCWEPAFDPTAAPASSRLTCVFPASATSTVDVATVADGKIVQRQRLSTTTGRLPMTRDGCNGWESAEWSPRATRVYLRSEYTCPTGIKRSTNGLIALAPGGEWLDVEGFKIGDRTGVRVVRYREAATPGVLPAEISAALTGTSLAVSTARTVLTGALTNADIVDATRHLDAAVVETWLTERRQGFSLDGDRLTSLADAGVAPSVIDVMVALSYPQVFAVQQRTGDGGTDFTRVIEDGDIGGMGPVVVAAPSDPFFRGYPGRYGYDRGYGVGPIGGYGYGIGSGFGWYSGNRPVVVVVRGSPEDDTPRPEGHAVKGRGYTQRDGGESSSGTTGSSSGSKGGGSAAGKSTGSGSGSTTRTAKPRKPSGD